MPKRFAQRQRTDEEATIAQLQAMQALTDITLSHLGLDDLLRELLSRLTAVIGVDNVGILLLEEDGQTVTLRAACGLMEDEVDRAKGAVDQGFPGRVAASRAPLVVDVPSAADFEGVPPFLRERLHSLAGVPLLVEEERQGHLTNELVGVLVVGSDNPHHFTETDVQLLQRAADRIALAIDRARLYAAEKDARQRAEAARMQAQRQADQLDRIFEAVTDGLSVWDAEGRLVRENEAGRRILGLGAATFDYDQLTRREMNDLFAIRDKQGRPMSPEEWPLLRALQGRVATGAEARDMRMRALDGREIEVNQSAAPLWDREGQLVGAVSVLHDLTERNQLAREQEAASASELAAREASRRMEAFLATAAHDLRTPLTATVGYLSLAERASDQLAAAVADEASSGLARLVGAVRHDLTEAHQSTARLARLLNVLFDTAAIRAGKLALHQAPFDLAALIREQVAALRVAAPERNIHLHMPKEGSDPIQVEADADRIAEVLMNFVANALKYSPPDQPVDVRVSAEVATRGGRAHVAVCDAGPGLPKEERSRVWELFHRAPGVVAQGGTSGGSLGLGLYICKAIITAHGGRVGVRSTLGQGSTFWFTLPLQKTAGNV